MKKKICTCFLVVMFGLFCRFLTGQNACAQDINESSGRIDITSENSAFIFTNVTSNGQVNVADWVPKAEQPKNWITQMALQPDKWQELWIEFTPSDSGYVSLQLRGSYYLDIKKNHHKVWIDDVTMQGKGAAVTNGSFEYLRDPNGNFIGWSWGNPSEAKYRQDPQFAHQGKTCALVWHDSPLITRLAVRAGEKYRLSVWFRTDSK